MNPDHNIKAAAINTLSDIDFDALSILIKNVPIKFSNYEKTHYALLNSRLTIDDDQDDLVIVHPDTSLTIPMLVCLGMISLLKLDINNKSQLVTSELTRGMPVGLLDNGRIYPGTYEGIVDNDYFGKMHKIVKNDNMSHQITLEQKWRIQPLSVMEDFKRGISKKLYGKQIEQALKIPKGSINALQKSKALIVTANKEDLIKQLQIINFGDDPFDKIFTLARSDGFDFTFVGRNNLKVLPQIMFCSDLTSAAEIVKSDQDIRLIFVVGNKNNDYSNLSYINDDEVPRKIVCLLNTTEGNMLADLVGQGFDPFVWKRPDFKIHDTIPRDQPRVLQEHSQALNALTESGFEAAKTDLPTGMETLIESAYKKVKELEKSYPNYIGFNFWLWYAYGLIKKLLQIPFNLEEFEQWLSKVGRNGEGVVSDFEIVVNKYEEFRKDFSPDVNELVDSLIKDLHDIISILSIDPNPKQSYIANLLEQNPELTAVFQSINPTYNDYLHYIFGHKKPEITIEDKQDEDPEIEDAGYFDKTTGQSENRSQVLIVTGWKSESACAGTFLAHYKKVIYLGYSREIIKYKNCFNYYSAGPNSDIDQKIRAELGFQNPHDNTFEMIEEAQKNVDEIEQEKSTDEQLRKVITENNYRPELITTSPHDAKVSATKVNLNNGRYIYLNDKHKVAKILTGYTDYKMVRVNKIQPHDKLMFVAGNRDLFQDVLDIVKQSPKYNTLYTTNEAWRNALIKYVEENNLSVSEVRNKLSVRGCDRTTITIRAWLEGYIICPDDDALEAIKLITQDDTLIHNMRDISAAGTKIRYIHMKTGVAIVRSILSWALNRPDDIELETTAEIEYQIARCASQAQIYEVDDVSNDQESISFKLEGHLQ